MNSRRIAKVRISIEILSMMLRAEFNNLDHIRTDAPKDLEVVGFAAVPDYPYYVGWVYCTSETFDEIMEGADAPEIPAFTYTLVNTS